VSRRPRPRPPRAAPNQSADSGTTGELVTTGPIRRFSADRAPLLRFVPLQHTSAASRALAPKAAGPPDVSRCGVCASPSARASGRDLGRRAFALAVFRFVGEITTRRRSGRRTVGVGRSIVANVSHGFSHTRVRHTAGHAFIDREDAISRRLAVRRAGGVGETDSSRVPHARGGPVGPSASRYTPP